MKYFNCPMSSSLFSSFQENTKCESSFFADTCTCCVPIFHKYKGNRQRAERGFKSVTGAKALIPLGYLQPGKGMHLRSLKFVNNRGRVVMVHE